MIIATAAAHFRRNCRRYAVAVAVRRAGSASADVAPHRAPPYQLARQLWTQASIHHNICTCYDPGAQMHEELLVRTRSS
eukprot:1923651-Pleurochrysis_carterae.AAC.1